MKTKQNTVSFFKDPREDVSTVLLNPDTKVLKEDALLFEKDWFWEDVSKMHIMDNEVYETTSKKVLAFKFKETSPLSLKGAYPFWFHLLIVKGYVILDGSRYSIVKPDSDGKSYLDFSDGDYIVSEGWFEEGNDLKDIMVYSPDEFKKIFRKVDIK